MSAGPERDEPQAAAPPTRRERLSARTAGYSQRLDRAAERHVSVAVPFRAARHNRRFAASALSGGFAYRLFFWLLPFSLVVGGALGFMDEDSAEDALATGGIPAAAAAAIGDAARDADTSRWWLLAVGVPALLWAGYTGTKATVLIHGLVWNDTPDKLGNMLKSSLVFTGILVGIIGLLGVTSWARDESQLGGVAVLVLALVPLFGLWLWVSLKLPHAGVRWTALLPGAVLFAFGVEVLHGLSVYFVLPGLEHSGEVYGAIGYTSVFLFWMYLAGRLVITAPILNVALSDELRTRRGEPGTGYDRGSPPHGEGPTPT